MAFCRVWQVFLVVNADGTRAARLGDFGVSRVLSAHTRMAETVIGSAHARGSNSHTRAAVHRPSGWRVAACVPLAARVLIMAARVLRGQRPSTSRRR